MHVRAAAFATAFDAVEDLLLIRPAVPERVARGPQEHPAQTVGLELVAPGQLVLAVLVRPGAGTVQLSQHPGLPLDVVPVLVTEQERVRLRFVVAGRRRHHVLYTHVQALVRAAVERRSVLARERTARAVSWRVRVHTVGIGELEPGLGDVARPRRVETAGVV